MGGSDIYTIVVFFVGVEALHVVVLVFPWWLTLKIAALLVVEKVAEVKRTRECDPSSREWENEVVPIVLSALTPRLNTFDAPVGRWYVFA